MSCLEICIGQICFSDSLPGGPGGKLAITIASGQPSAAPGRLAILLEGVLASQRRHRIMHRGRKLQLL
jgi:hypothetical protein